MAKKRTAVVAVANTTEDSSTPPTKSIRVQTPRHLIPSTLETALEDLKTNGYFWLPQQLPTSLCSECRTLIQQDLGKKLDAGSPHQEEPIERLEQQTGFAMQKLTSLLFENVLSPLLPDMPAHIPCSFTDTLYGRVKRKHFHTNYHTDAFNTIIERQLLVNENDQVNKFFTQQSLGEKIGWNDLPIYTFWVPLTPVDNANMSHLRIMPQSHLFKSYSVTKNNVLPNEFKYDKTKFVGPNFKETGGFQVGDVVVFHCLTLHEANPHRVGGKMERVSMDGRFAWEL
jgi:hypothetical protein